MGYLLVGARTGTLQYSTWFDYLLLRGRLQFRLHAANPVPAKACRKWLEKSGESAYILGDYNGQRHQRF